MWFDLAEPTLAREWDRTRDELLLEADRYLAAQQGRAREVFRRFASFLT